MTSLILSTAFLTASGLVAVTYACRGSSSPGRGWPSLRPTCGHADGVKVNKVTIPSTHLAFLDTALASDDDLGARLSFHGCNRKYIREGKSWTSYQGCGRKTWNVLLPARWTNYKILFFSVSLKLWTLDRQDIAAVEVTFQTVIICPFRIVAPQSRCASATDHNLHPHGS